MSHKCLFVILLFLFAAVQFTHGDQIQFNTSQLSNCTFAQACTYSWNNGNTWIGGRVPSPADDVEINIGKNVVIITCDNNCAAKRVQTSGKQLTFQLPTATSATFDQINATSGVVDFNGGSLTVKDFVQADGAVAISQFKDMQVSVDNMHLTAVAFSTSTVQIGTIKAQSFQVIQSHFTNQQHAYLFDVLSIDVSTLIFQAGCEVPDQTATRIVNSTLFTTPACPLMMYSQTDFYNSQWTVESAQPTALTISAPFVFSNSTVKLTRVNLSVKSSIAMYLDSVIESDLPIEISYGGRIGGQGSVLADLAVKNFGRIEFSCRTEELYLSHQQLTIAGTLSLDRSSTIHLQHFDSVHANSILLADASLEISFSFWILNWNFTLQQLNYTFISAQQGEISGDFDYTNVTLSLDMGYYQFVKTKSDLILFWQLNPPSTPHKAPQIAPTVTAAPVTAPIGSSAPVNEVIPPSSEPNSSPSGETDIKVVVIVIESVMIGVALLLGGLVVYRRFIKRRDYTQVPSFEQL